MKVAFVVQRYGLEISGGAELHCRWVTEHMKKYWDVEVLTTRALDYITWENHYTTSSAVVNGVPVRRFPVVKTRNPERFGKLQNFILKSEHREEDEILWLEEEGPFSPALIDYIEGHRDDYDYFIFFSYRYYHSYWGVKAVPHKSIIVPTAEHDPVIYLRIFKDLFRTPRGIVYNSVEEKKIINSVSGNENVNGEIAGVGTEVPEEIFSKQFSQKYGIKDDYIIYIGRIDKNKGCAELFDFFSRYKEETGSNIKLVLVGSTVLKIPIHPDIIYLGFLSEEEKFSALNNALLLLIPSFYESLSMVTNEAWAMHKPVLANARCEVLKGQCERSRAGLYYKNYSEFKEALMLFLGSSRLRSRMGKNGRKYFQDNYTWGTIEKKYLSLIKSLEKE